MIEIKNLSKVFHTAGGDVEALKDIDLRIEDGDIFGIIGLSGAGKSTLVRCMNLLEVPSEGRVLVDGKELTALPPRELRKARQSISMIFQGFNLLMQRTALDNICFPLELAGVKKQEARKRAKELLALVELPDKADAYPVQLSGGQKQRVAIARALASNPRVLLCDEATSALDPKTTRAILELLRKLNRELGVTVVVITHEMRVVEQICNRVAILDGDQIRETGPVSQVFSNPRSEAGRRLVLPEVKTAAQTLAASIQGIASILVSTFLGGVLADSFGIRPLFLIAAAVALSTAFLFLLVLRKNQTLSSAAQ